MRKFLIPLLMASATMPAAAIAQDEDRAHQPRSHSERSAQRDSSSDDRPQRVRRMEQSSGDTQRVQHMERSGGDSQQVQRMEGGDHPQRLQRRIRQVEASEPTQQVETTSEPVHVRRIERRDGLVGGFQQIGREAQEEQQQTQVEQRRDGDGFSGIRDRIVEHGDRTDRHRRWRSDWRKDHRYDWRSYRNRYGSLFRLGRYYDPYGWGYRRFSIGFNLWPSYFSSRYWINDPWMYRLPYAPPGYRWIRYWDDALLVDTWSGQVVDVIHNFFW